MNDLDAFAPQPEIVRIGERDVAVEPIRVRQLPAFGRAVAPILEALNAGQDPAAVALRMSQNVVDLVIAATDLDRAFIEDRHPDDLVRLLSVVLRVNADFFARRLAPALTEAMQAATEMASGPASSPTSSGKATASTKSSA
ncbi:hypothetical protein [Oceanicella actignis]|uniref:hypothetical protein n=1 Tax=Oceanicella actignis TaxID=1189325 RepID=UPI0011E69FA5|nr:hypothetical protein [Oceanicella actignis]TYO91428.1 hypothetical protein LY05_00281 [Oceanicella actignis]